MHISRLSPEARRVVEASVPAVVRNNPQRFPFYLPVKGLASTGLAVLTAGEEWADGCPLKRRKKQVGLIDSHL